MVMLSANTSLHDLLGEYPFLVDFLGELNPKFRMLKNPEMRATVARHATLEMVAGMGGIKLDDLIEAIEGEVARRGEGKANAAVEPEARAEKAAQLKSIIEDLHDGLDADVAKARFDAVVRDISPREIGAMEEQLIREGTPVEEIQRLCDLHVAIVQNSLEKQGVAEAPPGHPAHTYMAANEVITRHANRLGELCAAVDSGSPMDGGWDADFEAVLEKIGAVHNHYLRKENELFPVLERHGITGPSQVMWGIHDEIRAQIKATRAAVRSENVSSTGAVLARAIIEMVYKENKILIPLALETFTTEDWAEIRRGEDELGYALVEPAAPFPTSTEAATSMENELEAPAHASSSPEPKPRTGSGLSLSLPIISPEPVAPLPDAVEDGYLDLGTGRLSFEQVDMMLRHLPLDLSFVDPAGYVRYYSETEERLFPRTPGAIGRHVTNCHPPKSVHIVKEILSAFNAGERDVAEFWIEMQGKFIHIRYFAVRNLAKEYLGCLEVSQDVTGIRALEGERRLLDWR